MIKEHGQGVVGATITGSRPASIHEGWPGLKVRMGWVQRVPGAATREADSRPGPGQQAGQAGGAVLQVLVLPGARREAERPGHIAPDVNQPPVAPTVVVIVMRVLPPRNAAAPAEQKAAPRQDGGCVLGLGQACSSTGEHAS